jgi:hypothetical protein
VQVDVLKMEDAVKEIHEEMKYMREVRTVRMLFASSPSCFDGLSCMCQPAHIQREIAMRNTNGTYFVFSVRKCYGSCFFFPWQIPQARASLVSVYFSVAILALTAGGQLFYLKKFFKSKKLISW